MELMRWKKDHPHVNHPPPEVYSTATRMQQPARPPGLKGIELMQWKAQNLAAGRLHGEDYEHEPGPPPKHTRANRPGRLAR